MIEMTSVPPQLWRNIRMIAITFWKENKKWSERIDEDIMINPEITENPKKCQSQKKLVYRIPNVIWKVKRHQNIVVEYLDIFGRKRKTKETTMHL